MGRFFNPTVAHAHCDLMCGVYDPAQAKIEAMSVLKACTKAAESDDPVFKDRAILIKEERADLVKHHLSVLWTDFFKPHVESRRRPGDRSDLGRVLADRRVEGRRGLSPLIANPQGDQGIPGDGSVRRSRRALRRCLWPPSLG